MSAPVPKRNNGGAVSRYSAVLKRANTHAKGCSPDNSACEGFFGRLKNEFFHYRDWEGVTAEEFMGRLEAYLVYYREERIKKSLGWLSPMEYRRKLGYA